MRSHSKKSGQKLPEFSKEKIQEAKDWINSLPPQLKDKVEMLILVRTTEKLMKEFPIQKKRNATRRHRNSKR